MAKSNKGKQERILAERCAVEAAEAEKPAAEAVAEAVSDDPGIICVICDLCKEGILAETEESLQGAIEAHFAEQHPTQDAEPAAAAEEPVAPAEPEPAPVVVQAAPMSIADLTAMVKAALDELTGAKNTFAVIVEREQTQRAECENLYIMVEGMPNTVKEVVAQAREWAAMGLSVDVDAIVSKADKVADLYIAMKMTQEYAIGREWHERSVTKVETVKRVAAEESFEQALARQEEAFAQYVARRDAVLSGKLRAEHETHPILDVAGWVRQAISAASKKAREGKFRLSDQDFMVVRKIAITEALGWYGITKEPAGRPDPEWNKIVHRILDAELSLRLEFRARQDLAEKEGGAEAKALVKSLPDAEALKMIGYPNPKDFATDDTLGRPRHERFGASAKNDTLSEDSMLALKEAQRRSNLNPSQGAGRTRKNKKGR